MAVRVFLSITLALLANVAQASDNFDANAFAVGEHATIYLYAKIHELMSLGNHGDVVEAVDAALASGVPNVCPSGFPISTLSFMKGMALYGMGRIVPAQEAFAQTVLEVPGDKNAWCNLGDLFLFVFQMDSAIWAYDTAYKLSNASDYHGKLFKAKTWVCDWSGYEELYDAITATVLGNDSCRNPNITKSTIIATDFLDAPPQCIIRMSQSMNRATRQKLDRSQFTFPPTSSSLLAGNYYHTKKEGVTFPKLTIGFVSSDYGIHPVVTLLRGLVTGMDTSRFNVVCYALHDEESWWFHNISVGVPNFRKLSGLSVQQSVQAILSDGVDVLIDLNGHTLRTGLPLFGYNPALVQATFLGYPLTTAMSDIQYTIVDPIAFPLTVDVAYTEKFVYMPHSFFVTDYANTQDHIPLLPRVGLRTLSPFTSTLLVNNSATTHNTSAFKLPHDTVVLASFSNYQKIDPVVFDLWCNVLKRVPHAVLWLLKHHAEEFSERNLQDEAAARGIPRSRLIFTPKASWIDHIRQKTVADLVLDTVVKNGHTSSADALWAGVPVLSLRGVLPHARVTASLLTHAGPHVNATEAFSLKEYEDMAVRLATNPGLLSKLRHNNEATRTHAALFNSSQYNHDFERKMLDMFEVCVASAVPAPDALMPRCSKPLHIYATSHQHSLHFSELQANNRTQ